MRRDELYLVDMVEACRHIHSFLADVEPEVWAGSELIIRSAVLQKLGLLGEAAGHVSPEVRERHVEVPWARIRGFRNVAIHEYFAIEWSIVWEIASERLPELEKLLMDVLRGEFPDLARRLSEPNR